MIIAITKGYTQAESSQCYRAPKSIESSGENMAKQVDIKDRLKKIKAALNDITRLDRFDEKIKNITPTQSIAIDEILNIEICDNKVKEEMDYKQFVLSKLKRSIELHEGDLVCDEYKSLSRIQELKDNIRFCITILDAYMENNTSEEE